jgi:hypothetical protein
LQLYDSFETFQFKKVQKEKAPGRIQENANSLGGNNGAPISNRLRA